MAAGAGAGAETETGTGAEAEVAGSGTYKAVGSCSLPLSPSLSQSLQIEPMFTTLFIARGTLHAKKTTERPTIKTIKRMHRH